ncbi:MAG: hypothetical protein AUI36_43805 [Cyanobacteria bacterium 13_1_40CM_2_61_4]|nr:MAG: hypothetical protein AUI36_43805 [Cyanobacteria bacterium 13_1_40CM_2_61_4]
MNGFISRRVGAIALFAFIALAVSLLLIAAPTGRGAASMPAPGEIRATLTGVQIDDRISYTISLENVGDLSASSVTIDAYLSSGLTLAGTGGSVWTAALPGDLVGGQHTALGFVAVIDSGVAPGTLAVVDADVSYLATGPSLTSAHSEVTIAARGGVPLFVWIGALAGGVLVLLGYVWKVQSETVRIDQLFLLHDSGMLIRHYSNGQGVQRDSDIMSGMLIILQEFVRDSFNDPRGSLEEVRFGEKRVVMARGRHSIMAAVVTGKRLNGLPVRLQRAVGQFEQSHGEALSRWNGNLAGLDSADTALRSVLTARYRGPVPT